MGLRGYVACRMLAQHGFACRNLSGGFTRLKMWKAANAAARDPMGS